MVEEDKAGTEAMKVEELEAIAREEEPNEDGNG
jgi:hypothetical protein